LVSRKLARKARRFRRERLHNPSSIDGSQVLLWPTNACARRTTSGHPSERLISKCKRMRLTRLFAVCGGNQRLADRDQASETPRETYVPRSAQSAAIIFRQCIHIGMIPLRRAADNLG
jgi:hypothetical protein